MGLLFYLLVDAKLLVWIWSEMRVCSGIAKCDLVTIKCRIFLRHEHKLETNDQSGWVRRFLMTKFVKTCMYSNLQPHERGASIAPPSHINNTNYKIKHYCFDIVIYFIYSDTSCYVGNFGFGIGLVHVRYACGGWLVRTGCYRTWQMGDDLTCWHFLASHRYILYHRTPCSFSFLLCTLTSDWILLF